MSFYDHLDPAVRDACRDHGLPPLEACLLSIAHSLRQLNDTQGMASGSMFSILDRLRDLDMTLGGISSTLGARR